MDDGQRMMDKGRWLLAMAIGDGYWRWRLAIGDGYW